jgi:transposase
MAIRSPSGGTDLRSSNELWFVIEKRQLNGLDPESYLADIIDRMSKGHPINRLSELLPWN